MKVQLGRTIILVKDYDDAWEFYSKNLNARKIFETTTESGQRFLHIGFDNSDNVGVWFLKSNADKVGAQTAGEPLLVLYTDNLTALYEKLKSNNVVVKKEPTGTAEYRFFHFLDLYGNEIIAVELK